MLTNTEALSRLLRSHPHVLHCRYIKPLWVWVRCNKALVPDNLRMTTSDCSVLLMNTKEKETLTASNNSFYSHSLVDVQCPLTNQYYILYCVQLVCKLAKNIHFLHCSGLWNDKSIIDYDKNHTFVFVWTWCQEKQSICCIGVATHSANWIIDVGGPVMWLYWGRELSIIRSGAALKEPGLEPIRSDVRRRQSERFCLSRFVSISSETTRSSRPV